MGLPAQPRPRGAANQGCAGVDHQEHLRPRDGDDRRVHGLPGGLGRHGNAIVGRWPNSSRTSRWKELEALPPRQRIDKVTHTVADMGHPAIFKRCELSEVVRRRVDDITRDRTAMGRTDCWRYDHILEGLDGVHQPADQLRDTFAMEDITRAWGCNSWLEGQVKA